jgi:large subunit ribosomal protein L29
MANREANDIRRWDDERLDNEINEAYRALFTLRFQHASRQLENVRELRNARKRIARLRTLRRERQLQAAEQATASEE